MAKVINTEMKIDFVNKKKGVLSILHSYLLETLLNWPKRFPSIRFNNTPKIKDGLPSWS
jgi:hypothetical protein